jgi:hypothetical protein
LLALDVVIYNCLLNTLPAGSAFVQNASKPHKDCNCFNVTFFAEATVNAFQWGAQFPAKPLNNFQHLFIG